MRIETSLPVRVPLRLLVVLGRSIPGRTELWSEAGLVIRTSANVKGVVDGSDRSAPRVKHSGGTENPEWVAIAAVELCAEDDLVEKMLGLPPRLAPPAQFVDFEALQAARDGVRDEYQQFADRHHVTCLFGGTKEYINARPTALTLFVVGTEESVVLEYGHSDLASHWSHDVHLRRSDAQALRA